MAKALIYGGSIGLLLGVLMGVFGGTGMPEEILAVMAIGLIGGLSIGFCIGLLTRKGTGYESIGVPQDYGGQPSSGSYVMWLVPLIAFIAAAIKGFLVISSM